MLHGDRLLGDMIWDMDATLKAYIQRDQGLSSDDPWDALNDPVEDAHEVIIINRIELDEHRIRPRSEVALDDLRDLNAFAQRPPCRESQRSSRTPT